MDIGHLLQSQQLEFTYLEGFHLCNAIQTRIYRQLQPGDLVPPQEMLMAGFLKSAGTKLARNVHFCSGPRSKSLFKITFQPMELLSLYMAITYEEQTMGAYIKIEKATLKYSYLIDLSTINHSTQWKTSHSNLTHRITK